ncbi:MAG: hypothetical protein RR310_05860 [Eubacterium sp.]
MKILGKIIVALTIILVIGIVGINIIGKMDDKVITDEDINKVLSENSQLSTSITGFSKLNIDEQKVYLRITSEIEAKNSTFELGHNNTNVDSLNRIWEAVVQDNPQYFWLSEYSYKYNEETNEITSIEIKPLYNTEEIKKRQAKIDTSVESIKKGITADMGDYEKVKYVHDTIIQNTEYNLNAPDNQNICSVFIGHQTVCAGYSKAMQYVLNDLGISCTYVKGEAIGRGPHAWNLLEMDHENYYVDVTWDDPSFEDSSQKDLNYAEHIFFGVTTEDLQKTHILDETLGVYPIVNATADNYFVREKMLFNFNNTGEKQRFMTLLKTKIMQDNFRFSVKFTADGMSDQALNLIEYSDILEGISIRYLKDDTNNVMTFLIGS